MDAPHGCALSAVAVGVVLAAQRRPIPEPDGAAHRDEGDRVDHAGEEVRRCPAAAAQEDEQPFAQQQRARRERWLL